MKKWIKKIAAIGAGASMLGATLLGASAANLADYPSPFVANGMFNAIMVIGEDAQPIDNIGVTNIATSLQYVSTTAVSGTAEVSISEGVKIEKTGNDFNYYDEMNDIQDTPLDDTDMPEILTDGTYEDDEGDEETYTQTLDLEPATGILLLDQPKDMDADTYLSFNDSVNIYDYQLEFDDDVDYDDEADLEGTTLEIQGNTYTITGVDLDEAGAITEMTLMAGETTRWLTQSEPFTIMSNGESYTVTVIDVDEGATKCGIDVDGEIKWVDVDKTKDFGDLTIGVTDAVAVHEQAQDKDICEVNIGAQELTLSDGSEITVNNVDLDGSNVDINAGATNFTWTGFNIQFEPDDDINLKANEAWTDPVFGNFKILFSGVSKDTEMIEVSTSGSADATLTFENNDGEMVEIPWFIDEDNDVGAGENATILGNAADEQLLLGGESYTDPSGDTVEETTFLFVTAGGEAHVIEITDVDEDELKVDLKDVTYGTPYSNKDFIMGSNSIISLGSLGSAQLTFNNLTDADVDYVESNAANVAANMETSNAAQIVVDDDDAGGAPHVIITENDDGDQPIEDIEVDITWNSGDKEVEVSDVVFATQAVATFVDIEEGNSDIQVAATEKGTMVTFDDEDGDYVTIEHPEADAKGNVFVAPLGGETLSTQSGAVTVNKIDVGAVKFDSEVDDITAQNSIVVGGPCVNDAAADLMGSPADCTAGFELGKATVKLYENGGNVAMLVAGYSGEDTRAASRVIANYDKYDLDGSEVSVTTATETVTQVG